MSIMIHPERCNGCGLCRDVCPGSLLRPAGGKTEIGYPDECWSCTACVKACPKGAISLYLPPALGGNGTLLRAVREGWLIHWHFSGPDGQEDIISVDSRNANHY